MYKISDRVKAEYGEEDYELVDQLEPLALVCTLALTFIILLISFM